MIKHIITVVLGLAALVPFTSGISYQHDELLYTKQIWDEFKLDFPFSMFAQDDATIARAKEAVTGMFIDHELNGPQANLQALIDEDVKRGRFQPSSFDITPLEDSTPLESAAGVAQCKTCLALIDAVWEGLVDWTHRLMMPVRKEDLAPFADALCEYEVPNAVLKDWVILSARVHAAQQQRKHQYFLLSPRHRQGAKPREIAVVRAACKAFLAGKKVGEALGDKNEVPSLLTAAAAAQVEYLAAAKERGVEGLNGWELQGYEAPQPQRKCFNRHPQCDFWATKGECKINPNYMVGTATTGWCRAACQACAPPRRIPLLGVTDADTTALATTSAALLERMQTSGCTRGPACRWSEGQDAKATLAAAAGIDASSTTVLRNVAVVAGPVEDPLPVATTGRAAGVDPRLLEESAVLSVLPADKAVVFSSKGGSPPVMPPPPPATAPLVAQILWGELAGKCVYAGHGWWSYEVCYWAETNQMHIDAPSGLPVWVISLGKFKNADWTPRAVTDAALFATGAVVPAVVHSLGDGNECELTGESGVNSLEVDVEGEGATQQGGAAGSGAGGTVLRTSVIRFMCSPDGKMHVAVVEPGQCRYVIDVYLPSLCGVEGMRPAPGGGGVMPAAALQQQAAAAIGVVVDDDDPYLDPVDSDDEEVKELKPAAAAEGGVPAVAVAAGEEPLNDDVVLVLPLGGEEELLLRDEL